MSFHVAAATTQLSVNPSLRFTPGGTNGFAFDTGVLRGSLREQGESKGLSSVVYVPTGAKLDSSMGFLGHYRQFSTNQRYGTGAWYWPSEASLQPDGSVSVVWPATNDRPFERRAVYRWATPNALDVETSVGAKTNLTGFESFLASYFTPSFAKSQVYVRELPGHPGKKGFVKAELTGGQSRPFSGVSNPPRGALGESALPLGLPRS